MYTFPDPPTLVKAALEAGKPTYWPDATISSAFPSTGITEHHIQHAWDGSPTEARNYETAAIRVTVWGPKVGGIQRTTTNEVAGIIRAYLLEHGISGAWRVTRGAGRLSGIDAETGLPFCTFSLNAETKPVPVP